MSRHTTLVLSLLSTPISLSLGPTVCPGPVTHNPPPAVLVCTIHHRPRRLPPKHRDRVLVEARGRRTRNKRSGTRCSTLRGSGPPRTCLGFLYHKVFVISGTYWFSFHPTVSSGSDYRSREKPSVSLYLSLTTDILLYRRKPGS